MFYFLQIILLIKDSLQQQIHFNGNNFGNQWEGSLYILGRMDIAHKESTLRYASASRFNGRTVQQKISLLGCMYSL